MHFACQIKFQLHVLLHTPVSVKKEKKKLYQAPINTYMYSKFLSLFTPNGQTRTWKAELLATESKTQKQKQGGTNLKQQLA